MNRYYNKLLIGILISMLMSPIIRAQDTENIFQTRSEFKLSYKLSDKWTLALTPELRFDDSFSIDKYILELRTVYNPFKRLSLGASYRFVANDRETKSTEYLQRYAFDAKYKYKISRWTPSIRLRYTNYSEDDSDGEYLRYKAAVDYNIKKCKLTPFAGAELFQELNNSELHKVRYSIGGEYKLNKNNAISTAYKLDFFLQKNENKHIFHIAYKLKF